METLQQERLDEVEASRALAGIIYLFFKSVLKERQPGVSGSEKK